MALDTFKVLGGFGIYNQGSYLSGDSAPGGDSGLQDAAKTGSLFQRTDNAKVYVKVATNNNTSDWVELPNINTVISLINSSMPGISWREPADVADTTTYADVAAAESAANSNNTIDGVAITTGFRVLLTDLTSGNENVYVVTGTNSNWTFTEDTNEATSGDEVYIKSGTNAGNLFSYDGTEWVVQSGVSINNELGYLRAYTGKLSAGNVVPNYSTTNFVTQGSSLTAAISELDGNVYTTVGNRTYTTPEWITSSQSITASLQALDTGIFTAIGDRTYTTPNYVTSDESLTDSIQALDTATGEFSFINTYIGKGSLGSASPSYSSTNFVVQSSALTVAIGQLDTNIFSAIGNRTYTSPHYVTNSQSLTASIQALDTALNSVSTSVTNITNTLSTATSSGITTATVVDSVLCRNYNSVKWLVSVVNAGTPTNKQTVEILAVHNGTPTVDATTTDYSIYSMLIVGSDIGLTFAITLTGTGASQNMNLSIASSTSVNVKVIKLAI